MKLSMTPSSSSNSPPAATSFQDHNLTYATLSASASATATTTSAASSGCKSVLTINSLSSKSTRRVATGLKWIGDETSKNSSSTSKSLNIVSPFGFQAVETERTAPSFSFLDHPSPPDPPVSSPPFASRFDLLLNGSAETLLSEESVGRTSDHEIDSMMDNTNATDWGDRFCCISISSPHGALELCQSRSNDSLLGNSEGHTGGKRSAERYYGEHSTDTGDTKYPKSMKIQRKQASRTSSEVQGSGMGLALSLGISGLEDFRTNVINPYEIEVDCDSTWDEFVPQRVQFVDCDYSTDAYTYEPFDWDDFNEDEIDGPCPPFDYIADLCLDKLDGPDPFDELNVIVAPVETKSILKPLHQVILVQTKSTCEEDPSPVVPASQQPIRNLDGTIIYHSPAPLGQKQVEVEALNRIEDKAVTRTPIAGKGGVQLALSFFGS